MEIKGKIYQVQEPVTGMSSKGSWMKQEFVIETLDKYPKKVCIMLWGEELINKYDLVEGMTVTAFINIESRGYNGKWFTDVKVWKIEWDEQKRPDFPKKETPAAKEQEWPELSSTPYPSDSRDNISTDDLPF